MRSASHRGMELCCAHVVWLMDERRAEKQRRRGMMTHRHPKSVARRRQSSRATRPLVLLAFSSAPTRPPPGPRVGRAAAKKGRRDVPKRCHCQATHLAEPEGGRWRAGAITPRRRTGINMSQQPSRRQTYKTRGGPPGTRIPEPPALCFHAPRDALLIQNFARHRADGPRVDGRRHQPWLPLRRPEGSRCQPRRMARARGACSSMLNT